MSGRTVLHRMVGRPEPRVEPRVEHVDLDQGFAETLRRDPPMRRAPDEFAPNPARVAERAIQTIEEFGALPLKQLDDELAKRKAEVAELEKLGQTMRDLIMRVRQEYLDKLEKSRKVTSLTRESFAKLAEQFATIDEPATPAEEPAKEPETNEQLQSPTT